MASLIHRLVRRLIEHYFRRGGGHDDDDVYVIPMARPRKPDGSTDIDAALARMISKYPPGPLRDAAEEALNEMRENPPPAYWAELGFESQEAMNESFRKHWDEGHSGGDLEEWGRDISEEWERCPRCVPNPRPPSG